MKKLLMALVVATIIAAVVRGVAGQRGGGIRTVAAPGANDGSHRHHIPTPRADLVHTVDEAIEISASDLAGAPASDGAT